jgi:hypothetical protein
VRFDEIPAGAAASFALLTAVIDAIDAVLTDKLSRLERFSFIMNMVL